jgi:hypothetical protein
VEVVNPVTGARMSLLAKLDTGAAMSVLPTTAVSTLALKAIGNVWVAGYDRRPARLPTYFVNLEVAGHTLTYIEVTATLRGQGLLGRDVLNNFAVTFDGKNLSFDLIDP